jgi:predicted DNA-binding transcriptional regulator AlpA
MTEARAFSTRDAAKYCGIRPARLRALVKAGDAPRPVLVGKRQHIWLREALDGWLDRLAGKASNSNTNPFVARAEALKATRRGG